MTWFPFDEQTCNFKFSSWTYTLKELNLTLKSDQAETGNYMVNGVSEQQQRKQSLPIFETPALLHSAGMGLSRFPRHPP